MIFYIPETAYNRSAIYNIDRNSVEHLGELAAKEAESTSKAQFEDSQLQQSETGQTIDIPKKSYLQTLKPYSTIYNTDNIFSIIITPLKMFLNPAVLWVCFVAKSEITIAYDF